MPNIREQITEFATRLNVPAVSGGVIDATGSLNYEVVGVCRRGDADQEATRVKRDDHWHIGSCAKAITAVLYARLVDAGLAAWQTPIASLFPDLADQLAPEWQQCPIEDLFVCQAGMRANPSSKQMIKAYADNRPLPEQRTGMALWAMQDAPRTPGKFVYSNLGYMVIGAAIDRITGSSYEAALQDYVMQPLGVTSLGFGPPPRICGHHSRLRLGSLILFAGSPAEPQKVRSDNPAMFSSAGTLHLSLPDWAKFLHLFNSDGGDLLTAESIEHLLRIPTGDGMRMGKGWAYADLPGIAYGQQGSNTMWSATALIAADRRRIAFVVCNDGRTRVLGNSAVLAAALLEETSAHVS